MIKDLWEGPRYTEDELEIKKIKIIHRKTTN